MTPPKVGFRLTQHHCPRPYTRVMVALVLTLGVLLPGLALPGSHHPQTARTESRQTPTNQVGTAPDIASHDPWWPILVKSYYGPYNAAQKKPGLSSSSFRRPRLEQWVSPLKATKPFTLGVCFPHFKDPYWLAANYGIVKEAQKLGVGITLLEAGGYAHLDQQTRHIHRLADAGVDGIILASISYTGNDEAIAQTVGKGIPVVAMINDVHAPAVSAKAMIPFYDMGYFTGEFVARSAEEANLPQVRVAFFPGPEGAGWAPETLEGFRDAMQQFCGQMDLVDVRWGDTDSAVQNQLVRASLGEHGLVDYVVGNAMAAAEAADILASLGQNRRTTVVSTYITPPLYDKIARGEVAAAPSDLTVFQGRIAVDMLVHILNGEKPGRDMPFRSGPLSLMVTPATIAHFPYEGLFGPRNFQPVFSLKPER